MAKGEFLTLLGPNGAGKTTLLKVLATLLRPSSGEVYVDEVDIKSSPDKVRARIGFISDSLLLYENLTPLENLVFYGRMYRVENAKEKALKLIADVGLELSSSEPVKTFSRGMKQRLSIARSLINDPTILYLDEPFTGLDQHGRRMLGGILSSFHRDGRTLVMATHDLERSLRLGDRAAILNGGRLAFQGATGELDLDEFENTYFRYAGGRTTGERNDGPGSKS